MQAPTRLKLGPPRCRGFTLLDVALTTGIIAILSAIAMPRYSQSVTRHRADLAARRLVADLDLLRMRARAQGTYESGYYYAGGDYCRYVSDPDLDDVTKEYRTYLGEEPYRADIVEVSFDGGARTYMRYGNYGHPYWGGYIIIRVGDEQRKVIVDPSSGEATVE